MGAKWDDPKQMTKNQVHSYLPPGQRMTTLQENIAFQQACKEWGEAMLPHLYPGALVFMFGGPRMFAWLAIGMQLAGFEMWDTFCWLHGEGFPKAQGVIPETNQVYANAWQGYKTPALKPAWEAILCFRAPKRGMTYAELALKFGTACLNVDGGRIGTNRASTHNGPAETFGGGEPGRGSDTNSYKEPSGRYPPNLVLDESAGLMLDEQSKVGASRFFYCPKASTRERNAGCEDLPDRIKPGGMRTANGDAEKGHANFDKGFQDTIQKNDHTCVKPLALCKYLATLLLPPEIVNPRRLLVPFAGSGSEMIGAQQAGWDEIVGIEQDAGYCEIAIRRIEYWRTASIATTVSPPSSPERTDAA
jgi:hypothetical protein